MTELLFFSILIPCIKHYHFI